MSVEVKEQTEAVPFLGDGDGVKKPVEEKPEKIEVDVELIDKDTSGGFWIFKGPTLQRLATGTIFVTVFGITSCFMAMSFAYFNSTMTTLEKRYKIPTKVLGVLSTGNDISAMFSSIIIGYYLRNVHRPRWMGLGFLIITVFCIMNASLHFLYGAGEDALKLTHEFGNQNMTGNSTSSLSSSQLCTSEKTNCHMDIESWSPIIILFVAQLILGIGAGMVIIVGVAYMDDNTAKSKAPAMLTLSTFLRMMGPSAGYLLSSQCLKLYIDPRLRPLIKNTDPRWMGAWWLGYILLAVITLLSAFVIALFPRELPSAKARRLKQAKTDEPDPNDKHKAHSVSDMWKSVKGLAANKVYVYNMAASIVYFFGYNVYWTFSQKYIEMQYRQSASVASMASGPVPLSFSAVGVVLSGYVIYKFKPGARAIVSWNVIVDFLTVAGILCYSLIGCKDSDQLGSMATTSNSCSASCHCDYAFYSPICSPNNVTYTTACHAGCTAMSKDPFDNDRKIYTGCSCISAPNITDTDVSHWQTAVGGHCPVDCTQQFYIFLVVMCFLKLVGASSKSTNFLISLRCIPPEQKSFGLGLGSMVTSLLAFIPSPIFYGWLIDKYCLVWGKTCSNKGNCWLYDTYSLRYVLNYTAATFVLLGGFCNIFVWYYAKHLQIFDENEETKLSLKRKEENILQGLGSTLQLEIKEEKL
ncbi:solute carrier organic anion transporter family member 74D-like [Drosophila albomicans]|uniref:Solute carrier organic anion transporter family member n=1 Tax=Drosophila albomicans TaxID=7291 RepID=A0A6P8WUF6_DROAB|nr:solute carrier organic anion transporter family member 74D-like [Drosophila albomicans]